MPPVALHLHKAKSSSEGKSLLVLSALAHSRQGRPCTSKCFAYPGARPFPLAHIYSAEQRKKHDQEGNFSCVPQATLVTWITPTYRSLGQVSCSHSEIESGSLLFPSQEAMGVASLPESRLQPVLCCPQCVLLLK